MSNKIIDSIKHVIIEDDDPKPQGHTEAHAQPRAETASPVAVPVAASPESTAYQPATTPPMSEETEHVYQRILAKTNFNTTQVAATIHKYLDPLSAIPSLDERTKFKTAVIQAKAQEGLTQEKILATFDASAAATKQREIDDRQKRVQEVTDAIAQKQKEIAQLQQRLSDVTTELVGAQGKIQRAESQFAIAEQRRALEIDQEKAKYVSLLQG